MKTMDTDATRRRIFTVFSGVALCVGLCACASTGGVTKAQTAWDNRVVLAGSAKMKIAVASVHTRLANGLLEVQLNGLNKSARNFRMHYKIDWLDAEGFQISTPNSAWLAKEIAGKGPFQITALAQSPKIQNFRFFIK